MQPDPPVSLWPDPTALAPLTDLYQLTMMAGYYSAGRAGDRATFELFARRLPAHRSYMVFAGLEQALGDLLRLRFSAEQVDAFRSWPVFAGVDPGFFDALLNFEFQGDVWAVPEGTVVFAGEPLVRVEAALPEAQLVETFLLSSLAYPSLVASKASRVVAAAAGRSVFDYGARRGHGPHAGLLAARASYLAGVAGTSHVEAARRLGIPCIGTMAHSWVQSFHSEAEAFAAFAKVFPQASTLLVDTYDTARGVRTAAAIEPPVQAIRIDSGDLLAQAQEVRAFLDANDRDKVRIVVSGDLDEHSIEKLVAANAPIDAFGVGTEMITSRDAPAVSMVYKLVEIAGEGRVKLSPGKATYPFAKQVFRARDAQGRFCGDVVARANEASDGEPLLEPWIREGRLIRPLPRLDVIRTHCRDQVAALPDALHSLDSLGAYPVSFSAALQRGAERLAEHA